MKLIKPMQVTDAILTSSTIAETDYSAWSSSSEYVVGHRIIRPNHHIYEAVASSTNVTPENDATKWLDLGYTNRWRMFDQKVGTSSTATTSMTVVLTPGALCTGLALMELVGDSVTVQVDSVDGTVYNLTAPIPEANWYQYFFDEVQRMPFLVLTDLPMYVSSSVITITITAAPGSPVGCGVCVIGRAVEFADAVQYGAGAGITDYSVKGTDAFGNTTVVQRAWSKRASWQFTMSNDKLPKFQRTMADLRAIPAIYIGSAIYDQTVVYGFFKDFDVTIDYPRYSSCSIEIEGLI